MYVITRISVLLGKSLIVAQLVNKFLSCYESKSFFTYSKQRATDHLKNPSNREPSKAPEATFLGLQNCCCPIVKYEIRKTVNMKNVVSRCDTVESGR